jgi:hypothetical protein
MEKPNTDPPSGLRAKGQYTSTPSLQQSVEFVKPELFDCDHAQRTRESILN